MAIKHTRLALIGACALILAAAPTGGLAQYASAVGNDDALHAGQLDVPVNKSQILRADRAFSRALIGNDEVADILPMNDRSLYVLGKKVGTTSLTLYDRGNNLISIIDIAVGPDIVGLRRQLTEIMPNEQIAVRMSNDAIVLSGTVSSGPAVDRAYQLASTYAPDKVVNLLSVGSVQQVMLEVRFSEMSRQVGKQIGFNHAFMSDNGRFQGGIGETSPTTALLTNQEGRPVIDISKIVETFGLGAGSFSIGSLNLFSALDLMERKGLVKTLAEPTLIALSGHDLPPSGWSKIYVILDHPEGTEECHSRNTRRRRLSASCARQRLFWRREERQRTPVVGYRSASKPITAGAKSMAV